MASLSSGGYDLASIRARAKGLSSDENPHQASTFSLDADNHDLDSSSNSSDSGANLTEEKVERFDSSKRLKASDEEGSDDELSRTFAPLDGEPKAKPVVKRMNSADTFDSNDSELDLSKTFADTDFSKIAIMPKVHDDSDDSGSSDSSKEDQELSWQKSLSFNGRRTSDSIDDTPKNREKGAVDDIKEELQNSNTNFGDISSSSSEDDSSSDEGSVKQKSPQSPPSRQIEQNNSSFSSAKATPQALGTPPSTPLRASYKAAKVSDPSAFESSASKLSFSKAPDKLELISFEKPQTQLTKDEPSIPPTDDLVHMKLDMREHLAMLTKQNAELFTQLSKRDEECVEAIQEKDKLALELQTASFREAEAVVFLRRYRRFYRNLIMEAKLPKSSIVPSTEELIDMDRLMMESGLLEPDEVGVDKVDDADGGYVPSQIAIQMSSKQAGKMQDRLQKNLETDKEKNVNDDASSSSSSSANNEFEKEADGSTRETPVQLEARSKELETPAGRYLLNREDELENGLMVLTAKYLDVKQKLSEKLEEGKHATGETSGSGIFSSMMSVTKSPPPKQPEATEATEEGSSATKGAQAKVLMAILRQLKDVQAASQVTQDKVKMQNEEMEKMQTMLSSTQEKCDKLQAQLQRQRGAAGKYQAVVWKLKDVQAESDMHRSSLEEKEKECSDLEADLAQMREKCNKLELELANAITQKNEAPFDQSTLHVLETKLQKAEDRYNVLEEEAEALVSSKDELIAKAHHELYLAHEQLDDFESKESSIKSLFDLQKKKIESLESEVESLQEFKSLSTKSDDEIGKVRHEHSTAQERIDSFEAIESKLRDDLRVQSETISQLKVELDNTKQQCMTMEKELGEAKEQYTVESEQYQESIAALKMKSSATLKSRPLSNTGKAGSENAEFVYDSSELDGSLSDAHLKLEESQQRCEDLQNEIDRLTSQHCSQLEELNEIIRGLKLDLSESNEHAHHLEKKLDDSVSQKVAEETTEDSEVGVDELNDERANVLEAEIEDYKMRIESMQKELLQVSGHKSAQNKEQQDAISQLQEELKEISTQRDKEMQEGLIEKAELESSLQDGVNRVRELSEQLEKLKSENSSLRDDHETSFANFEKKLSDERERCEALEEEREQNKVSAADFLRELSECQTRCKNLEDELKQESENSKAERESYRERVVELEAELSKAHEAQEPFKGEIETPRESVNKGPLAKVEEPQADTADGEGEEGAQIRPVARPRNGSLVSVDSLSVSGLAVAQEKNIYERSYEKSQDFFGEVPSPPKTYKPKFQIDSGNMNDAEREDVILEGDEKDDENSLLEDVPPESSPDVGQGATIEDENASNSNETNSQEEKDKPSSNDQQTDSSMPVAMVKEESIVSHSDEGSDSEISAITMDPKIKAEKKKKKAKKDRKKGEKSEKSTPSLEKDDSRGSLSLDDDLSKSSKIVRQGSKGDFSTIISKKKTKKSSSKSSYVDDDDASRISKSSRISKASRISKSVKKDKLKKHKSKKSLSKDDGTAASAKSSKTKKHKSKKTCLDDDSSKKSSRENADVEK